MIRSTLPLNSLRAFEAAARHLSFTLASQELCVTQAAVSHQVKSLEQLLGVRLFRRLPRGLALTDEGQALVPVVTRSFDAIQTTLDRFVDGHFREVVTIGMVGTFATGWLLARLPAFQDAHPYIDLRILTNNNRVDIAGEGLDFAIRFGDGSWTGTDSLPLFSAPLSPVCSPAVAAHLGGPGDLPGEVLLRSYRADEWASWFQAANIPCPVIRGTVFDSSLALAEAARQGVGIALLPVRLFFRELDRGTLVQPFPIEVDVGAYWLTWLKSRRETTGMAIFRDWLVGRAAEERS
ncbi:MAG: LysR family transcriptional regulator [Telmatospirillum sp.]|nr:LysR family transcriptional regulator [Telmatospirillum sp.]